MQLYHVILQHTIILRTTIASLKTQANPTAFVESGIGLYIVLYFF